MEHSVYLVRGTALDLSVLVPVHIVKLEQWQIRTKLTAVGEYLQSNDKPPPPAPFIRTIPRVLLSSDSDSSISMYSKYFVIVIWLSIRWIVSVILAYSAE
jgi:hypothetical protein